MKLKKCLVSLPFILLFLCSCDKNEGKACCGTPSVINLFVKDTLGNAVEGASVKFYLSSTDWANQTNQLGNTLVSDSIGEVFYIIQANKPAANYYWFVQDGNLNNAHNAITNTTPITYGASNFTTVIN
jgi:hypothetical protein